MVKEDSYHYQSIDHHKLSRGSEKQLLGTAEVIIDIWQLSNILVQLSQMQWEPKID